MDLLFRRQETINIAKEDIDKQKKLLLKKKPTKNPDFAKPSDRTFAKPGEKP